MFNKRKVKEARKKARDFIDEDRYEEIPEVKLQRKKVRFNFRYALAIFGLSLVLFPLSINIVKQYFNNNPMIGTGTLILLDDPRYEGIECQMEGSRTELVDRKNNLSSVLFTGRVSISEEEKVTAVNEGLSPVFQPSVLYWEKDILRWAQQYELDPNLIATVMQIESCGDPNAGSGAGALGLFQVMPYHFDAGEDSLNPEINAKGGLSYLQRSYELAQGDVTKAFAGYNGGHGVISQHPAYWPTETLRYAMWGTGIMLDISQDKEQSPTLQSWLTSGGLGLCNNATKQLAIIQ